MTDKISCGECSQPVAQAIGNAIVIKKNHGGQQHVTIITVDRLLQEEPSLRPSVKRV